MPNILVKIYPCSKGTCEDCNLLIFDDFGSGPYCAANHKLLYTNGYPKRPMSCIMAEKNYTEYVDFQHKIAREYGCGDNSCMFGSPGGMGTNGGCRCLKDLKYGPNSAHSKVMGGIRALLKEIERLKCGDSED